MSYADLRDFDPEYSVTVNGYLYEIEKLGGGTLGKAYEGYWRCVVTAPDGEEIYRGQGLFTGTPKRHDEIPAILCDFLIGEILDSEEFADLMAMPDD